MTSNKKYRVLAIVLILIVYLFTIASVPGNTSKEFEYCLMDIRQFCDVTNDIEYQNLKAISCAKTEILCWTEKDTISSDYSSEYRNQIISNLISDGVPLQEEFCIIFGVQLKEKCIEEVNEVFPMTDKTKIVEHAVKNLTQTNIVTEEVLCPRTNCIIKRIKSSFALEYLIEISNKIELKNVQDPAEFCSDQVKQAKD